MAMKDKLSSAAKKGPRKGKTAVLVYFPTEQAVNLSTVARARRVPKAELIRVAVGRLLNELNSGQLDLPLGL